MPPPIPARLTPSTLATPVALVWPLPAATPLSEKLTVLPLKPTPPDVSVAERSAVPPYTPRAGSTASADARSSKHTVTSLSAGVFDGLVVVSDALYLRYRWPLNCASEPPLLKKVPVVPSGPTKTNFPLALSLAATWNLMSVPAGVVAVQDSVRQFTAAPGAGLASLADDTNVPEPTKLLFMYVLNPISVVCPAHEIPLFAEVTRRPLA